MLRRSIAVVLLLIPLCAVPSMPSVRLIATAASTVDINELIAAVHIALGERAGVRLPGYGPQRQRLRVDRRADRRGQRRAQRLPGRRDSPTATSPATPTPSVMRRSSPPTTADASSRCATAASASSTAASTIRVLVNAIAADAVPQRREPAAGRQHRHQGRVRASDCSNDADLVRWRVMRKEAPGFDPEDGDWHWQWVDAPSAARALRRQEHLRRLSPATATACSARLHVHRRCATRGSAAPMLQALPGALLSISGTSPTDVYAVGADPEDGRGPLVVHYDGASWERLDSGATGDLWWISVAADRRATSTWPATAA